MVLFVKSIKKIKWDVAQKHPFLAFKAFIAQFVLFTANLLQQIICLFLYPLSFKKSIGKDILIWTYGSIGDNIVKIKAILSIKNKFPNSKIILLVQQDHNYTSFIGADEILLNLNIVNKIEKVPVLKTRNRKKIAAFYSKYKNHRLFIFPPFTTLFAHMKFTISFWFYGLRCVQGFYIANSKMFAKAQNSIFTFLPESQKFNNNLPFNPINTNLSNLLETNYDKNIEKLVFEKLKKNNLASTKELLLISFAGKSPLNRYSPNKFAKIIDKWVTAGGNVALIGSASQKDDAFEIKKLVDPKNIQNVFNLCGEFSLYKTLYLLNLSTLLLTMDTGTAHMATLTTTPTLVLYTSYNYNGYWLADGANINYIRKEFACSPCYASASSICKYGAPSKCLEAISVKEIWRNLQNLKNSRTKV